MPLGFENVSPSLVKIGPVWAEKTLVARNREITYRQTSTTNKDYKVDPFFKYRRYTVFYVLGRLVLGWGNDRAMFVDCLLYTQLEA
uniref:Uncharacterized protein n=1 Tax=Caenorhabditis japonica TaxID=281687 RepID=A0A8R1IJJ3_CAEJA